jgi:hypothetical protein
MRPHQFSEISAFAAGNVEIVGAHLGEALHQFCHG